jgi:uncharacterized membrane protein
VCVFLFNETNNYNNKVNSFDEVLTAIPNPNATTNAVAFSNLTKSNVNINKEPNRNCNTSLLAVTLVVFFTALFLVIVGEILVPRIVSVVILLVCACAFYAGTIASLYVAANACPGATYLETVDTVRNLIIACAAMLFIVMVFDRQTTKNKRAVLFFSQFL